MGCDWKLVYRCCRPSRAGSSRYSTMMTRDMSCRRSENVELQIVGADASNVVLQDFPLGNEFQITIAPVKIVISETSTFHCNSCAANFEILDGKKIVNKRCGRRLGRELKQCKI